MDRILGMSRERKPWIISGSTIDVGEYLRQKGTIIYSESFDIGKYLDSTGMYIDIDKYTFDIDAWLDRISIDIDKIWKETERILFELPLFRTVADPRSRQWNLRAKEEFEIFNKFKDMQHHATGRVTFNHLVQKRPRVWQCSFISPDGDMEILEIRLPIDYPIEPPEVMGRGEHTKPYTHNACLGELEKQWSRARGKKGIAHFLVLLGYYISLEEYSHRINH